MIVAGQVPHTVPYGTDLFCRTIPGSKLPGRLRRLRRTRSLRFCPTNRCDRDVGLAESGYDQLVPSGQAY